MLSSVSPWVIQGVARKCMALLPAEEQRKHNREIK